MSAETAVPQTFFLIWGNLKLPPFQWHAAPPLSTKEKPLRGNSSEGEGMKNRKFISLFCR